MDSVQSFRGYGKVDEAEDRTHRRRTCRRTIIICVSSLLLIAAVVAITVGVFLSKHDDGDSGSAPAAEMTPSSSIKAVCSVTQYPDSCFSSISRYQLHSKTIDPEEIFKISLLVAVEGLVGLVNYTDGLVGQVSDPLEHSALLVCQEVLADAVDTLNQSISAMNVEGGKLLSPKKVSDLRTWLSTVLSDQETCLDALQEANSTHFDGTKLTMTNSTELASNSLAIITKILSLLSKFKIPMHRRLLSFGDCCDHSGFPAWLSIADRRLLEETNPKPDLVVAQDGSGNYRTIKEAVKDIPAKSPSRFVIYVKAGTYKENVILEKKKWNVMIYGDGMTQTIVTGSKNFVDGTSTFATATFGKILGSLLT